MKFSHIIIATAMVAVLSGCGNSTRATSPANLGDTTPPPAVTGITVLTNGATKDVTVLWDPSAAPDVANYQVFIADNSQYSLVGSTTATRMEVPTATVQTSFAVRAIDGAGNASPYALYTPGGDTVQ